MGTKVLLAMCGAAEAFLLYALFNFAQDGKRVQRIQLAVKSFPAGRSRNDVNIVSKAA